jgi:hypothetical protein
VADARPGPAAGGREAPDAGAGGDADDDASAPRRRPTTRPAPGSPEARAPITTEYVRGEGKRKKRRKRAEPEASSPAPGRVSYADHVRDIPDFPSRG